MINFLRGLPKNRKCLLLITIIVILIKVLLLLLRRACNMYFLLGLINQDTLDFCLMTAIIICLFATILLFIHKIWIKIIIAVLGLLIVLFEYSFYSFGNTEPKYFIFNSPNNQYTMLVEEETWLLGGWSNIYLKQNILFSKDLKISLDTDDGYRPFSDGSYKITWLNNHTAEIYYNDGQNDTMKKEVINLKVK